MDQMYDPNAPKGVFSIYQYDMEEPKPDEMRQWIGDKFLAFLKDNGLTNVTEDWDSRLFNSGLRFDYSIQLWLEPGYFLVYDCYVTFDKVNTSKIEGLEVAPYQLTFQSSFDYPIGCARNTILTFRYQWVEELPSAMNAATVAVNLQNMAIFLSEVITQ